MIKVYRSCFQLPFFENCFVFQSIFQLSFLTKVLLTMNYNWLAWLVLWWFLQCMKKLCIDWHNARKFEKISKIQSFKILPITMMKLRKYQSWTSQIITTIWRNYSESYFLQNWARILIWIISDLIKNYRHIIKEIDCSNYFPFKYICVHILCRFSDTWIIMTS